MRFCEFRAKEVVNLVDGKSLGYICDLVIDEATGAICAIVLPGCGLGGLFKSRQYVVPWRNICKIGCDIILVEVDLACCCTVK